MAAVCPAADPGKRRVMQFGETARRPAERRPSRPRSDAPATDGPGFLTPRRHGPSALIGGRFAGRPVVAFIVAALAGFVILAALAILVGWVLQHYVLPDHGIGHADEHVNVWLSHHRTGARNDASFWMSGVGDIPAIPVVVALTMAVAAVRRHWRVAAFILTAIAVEAATYRAATLAVHRQRPRVPASTTSRSMPATTPATPPRRSPSTAASPS